MNLLDKIKKVLVTSSSNSQQIVINNGDILRKNKSRYVADWVYSFNNSLKCSDGSTLPIEATNSVITGVSSYKNEILIRQIVAGISKGYTPLVVSIKGRDGLLYRVLRSIYEESAIDYVSENYASGRYSPFTGMTADKIVDFFYQLVCDFQPEQTNGMLIRNYVKVCVAVFFFKQQYSSKSDYGTT